MEGIDGKGWEVLLLMKKLDAEGEFSGNVY